MHWINLAFNVLVWCIWLMVRREVQEEWETEGNMGLEVFLQALFS